MVEAQECWIQLCCINRAPYCVHDQQSGFDYLITGVYSSDKHTQNSFLKKSFLIHLPSIKPRIFSSQRGSPKVVTILFPASDNFRREEAETQRLASHWTTSPVGGHDQTNHSLAHLTRNVYLRNNCERNGHILDKCAINCAKGVSEWFFFLYPVLHLTKDKTTDRMCVWDVFGNALVLLVKQALTWISNSNALCL